MTIRTPHRTARQHARARIAAVTGLGLVIPVLAPALAPALVLAVTAPAAQSATPTCHGKPATIVGTAKDDVITGTAGDDVIVAGYGSDIVKGLDGNDTICGGLGDDGRSSDDGWNDDLDGGPGDDLLDGSSGADKLTGGAGNDRLIGGWDGTGSEFCSDGLCEESSAGDLLIGGPGNDRLEPGQDSEGIGGIERMDTISFADAPATPGSPGVTVNLAAGTATGHGNDVLHFAEGDGGGDETVVEVAVLGSRGDDTISDLPRGYEVSLNGGPGNDTITAHDSSTTIVEGVDPGRSLPLGRGTYRIGQEFAGQDPGRSNRYRRTATENGRGDNLGGFILNGGGGTVTAGPGWDNLRIAGNSTHRINLGAGRGDVEVQGKATHGPITASTGADVRYFRDLGSSRSAVKINASKGTVAVSGTNGFKNLGTVRRVTDWTLRTRGALTFTGTSRADQLTARAQLLTARLYEGNDKVTAVMLAKKGTSINGGKGRDTARLRLQKGKKQVKFKATLISVEIRR